MSTKNRKSSKRFLFDILFFFIFALALNFEISSHTSLVISEAIAFSGLGLSYALYGFRGKKSETDAHSFRYLFLTEILVLLIIDVTRQYLNRVQMPIQSFVLVYVVIYLFVIALYLAAQSKIKSFLLRISQIPELGQGSVETVSEYLKKEHDLGIRVFVTELTTKVSATATIDGNFLNVYIRNIIFEELTDNELSLLILHEFAHIKLKHSLKTLALYGSSIFMFTLLSFIVIFGYSGNLIFYVFLASFGYFAASLGLYNKIKFLNESRADQFALNILADNKSMISLLQKLYEFVLANAKEQDVGPTLKFKERRLGKIEQRQRRTD